MYANPPPSAATTSTAVLPDAHRSVFARTKAAIASATPVLRRAGTPTVTLLRTPAATTVDGDGDHETVGDGVPPGALGVVDVVGELLGDARFVDDSDG